MPPFASRNRPRRARFGAGERALLVAEQLGLDQARRERRAVERDERPVGARADAMDRAREQLLAGAALADDQHGRIRGRDAIDHREQLAHQRRLADHLAEAARALDLAAQPADLARERAVLDRAIDDRADRRAVGVLVEHVERAGRASRAP